MKTENLNLKIKCGNSILTLFQMAGDEALSNDQYEHALELYHLSKVIFFIVSPQNRLN